MRRAKAAGNCVGVVTRFSFLPTVALNPTTDFSSAFASCVLDFSQLAFVLLGDVSCNVARMYMWEIVAFLEYFVDPMRTFSFPTRKRLFCVRRFDLS